MKFVDVGLTEEDIKTISEDLTTNGTLTYLSLNQNKIGANGTKILCEALKKNATITRLDLFGIHKLSLCTLTNTNAFFLFFL